MLSPIPMRIYVRRHTRRSCFGSRVADRPFLLLTSLVARVSVSEWIFSNLSFPVRKAILSPLGKGDDTSLGREQMILHLPLLLERPQLMRAMIKTYKPIKEKGTKSLLCPEGEPGVILSWCDFILVCSEFSILQESMMTSRSPVQL